ncbi:hypothetical protein B0T25DRAFT_583308 [Lasiosphaeria hispida]|uniref:Protein kinase domain-containing protein n=1 Tax=Lasiosphaeria hispida TaxID=260671 RepID=A0AAJ0MA94_9PEZI|nr:hypothetical protein B0T25DRAFT_583308 [Lasiosphaeria hispida]
MTWAEEDERDKITSGKYKELREVAILTRRLIPDFPPHVVALCLSEWGSVVWTSTDAQLHPRIATECYPWVAEYQLSSPGLPVVTRSQLTVIGRLGWGLDKVTHDGFRDIRVPIQFLVVEELTCLGVVGFTTPFISGPTLDQQWSFKLRWLREIFSVVDLINLQYGTSHQDIADRNFFVNSDTDSVVLYDFNYSVPVDGGDPLRGDIRGVILMVYFLVTRDAKFKEISLPAIDETKLEKAKTRENWIKHTKVELDDDVFVFYDELMAWVRKRQEGSHQSTKALHTIHVPLPPSGPRDVVVLEGCEVPLIDPTRRLLATGRYVDEEEAEEKSRTGIFVPDPKRGFPPPPGVEADKGSRQHRKPGWGRDSRQTKKGRFPKARKKDTVRRRRGRSTTGGGQAAKKAGKNRGLRLRSLEGLVEMSLSGRLISHLGSGECQPELGNL